MTAAEKAREGKMKKEFPRAFTMLSGHGRILPEKKALHSVVVVVQ